MTIVTAAVIQAAPVLFDLAKTIEKACDLISSAAKADLILLPEAFIPAYPRGFGFGMKVGSRNDAGRDLWKTYYDNSIKVPGPDVDILGKAAKEAKAHVCIGVIEKDGNLDDLIKAKLDFDVIGHYARPDVFNLTINTAPRPSVQFQDQ